MFRSEAQISVFSWWECPFPIQQQICGRLSKKCPWADFFEFGKFGTKEGEGGRKINYAEHNGWKNSFSTFARGKEGERGDDLPPNGWVEVGVGQQIRTT